MRLTLYTDYALRVLMHLSLHRDQLCSIGDIAQAYLVSHNHLMKVVNALVREGFVESVRGRSGGIRLARSPAEISVGAVVRSTEDSLQLADCGSCIIAPACALQCVLAQGVEAMLAVFDTYTLADLTEGRSDLSHLLSHA